MKTTDFKALRDRLERPEIRELYSDEEANGIKMFLQAAEEDALKGEAEQ